MASQDGSAGTVKTADTLFQVIEGLRALDGAGVTELASHLDIAKSTAHRHLKTLERAEYVVKEGKTYFVSLRFLGLGEYARDRNSVYRLAAPIINELAIETEERSRFMVEEHGRAVYLAQGLGNHAIQTSSNIGTRRYLHTIAGGKAMLAHFPEDRVWEIIDQHGLPANTPNTITDPEVLFDELDTIREQGVAFNREECVLRLKAVSAPVLGNNGRLLGALSVSGPARRMKGKWFEEEIADLLLGYANELELNAEYTRARERGNHSGVSTSRLLEPGND